MGVYYGFYTPSEFKGVGYYPSPLESYGKSTFLQCSAGRREGGLWSLITAPTPPQSFRELGITPLPLRAMANLHFFNVLLGGGRVGYGG